MPWVAILVIAGFGLQCSHGTPTIDPKSIQIDDLVSAFDLPAVGPIPFHPQDLRERVVVVTFLATWCFPCLGQMPVFDKLQRKYGSEGLLVVAIGMDREGSVVLEPFVREYGLPFPVLVSDEKMRNGKTAFGRINSLPASMVFGRDGRLIVAYTGLAVASDLEQIVSREVGRRPPRD